MSNSSGPNITIPPISVPPGSNLETTLVDTAIGVGVPLGLALIGWGVHALMLHFHIAGCINLPGLPVSSITAAAQQAANAAINKTPPV